MPPVGRRAGRLKDSRIVPDVMDGSPLATVSKTRVASQKLIVPSVGWFRWASYAGRSWWSSRYHGAGLPYGANWPTRNAFGSDPVGSLAMGTAPNAALAT